ncbi:MAG: hypothetical protein KAQ68_07195 [Clostridiales bacterium]|nr:hypothetical protein [Clostridiales bacterium]
MKKTMMITLTVALIMTAMLSGCSLLNKIPEKYTEGIKLHRDFPDDIIEVYDDAIVFEDDERFGEIVISCGTEDDIDDIIDFYKDFFEDEEIVPTSEEEDRDEYNVAFIEDGYAIELQVVEAEGEYVEDVFEYVIYISAKETDETEMQAATPSPTPMETPTVASDTVPTEELTLATTLSTGSWTIYMTEGVDGLNDSDYNFEIYDETSGTMYYTNISKNTQWTYDFTYTYVGDTLTFSLSNGTDLIYIADLYGNTLELTNESDTTIVHYFMNWNDEYDIFYSADTFTAFGSWVFFEPDTYTINTISFWPSGVGFAYNWVSEFTNEPFSWSYENSEITLYHDNGDVQTYTLYHNGNVIELIANNEISVLNRAASTWLSGYYTMYETTDEYVVTWDLDIGNDHSLYYYALYSDDDTYTYEDAHWYIEPDTGRFYVQLTEELEYAFDYHYSPLSTIIVDQAVDEYYYMGGVG